MKTAVGIILLILGLVVGGLGSYVASSGQIGALQIQVSGMQAQITELQGNVSSLSHSLSHAEAQATFYHQQLQGLLVPLITFVSCPSTVSVGEHFAVTCNVTGGIPGKITHFGIHLDTSQADLVSDLFTGDTPQTFQEVVPAPNQTGTFAIRAHALIDGEEVWSEAQIISVESSSTFNLSISAAQILVNKADQSTTLVVTVTSVGGFNSPVTLSLTGIPPAMTATLSPTTVTPPADGQANAALSVSVIPGLRYGVNASPPFGVFALHITGTSGSTTRSDALHVIVTNPLNAFTVAIIGFSFQPATITIPVGGTVVWINTDPVTHSVTSSIWAWDSGDLEMDKSFAHTFDTVGTFTYHCKYHHFSGTVIVTP